MKYPLIPNIKSRKKKTSRSYSTFTKKDKQSLYRILIKRGVHPETAKERINEIEKEQNKIRKKMKETDNEQQDLKRKQDKMIQDLFGSIK